MDYLKREACRIIIFRPVVFAGRPQVVEYHKGWPLRVVVADTLHVLVLG